MIVTIVSTLLGTSILTVTVAVAPSITVTLPILTVGRESLSLIVTVPEVIVLVVVPLVIVPLTVKVSFGSSVPSSTVGMFTVILVSPALIVTVSVVVV